MTSVGVFSLVYAPFFSMFLAHGVGVSQDAIHEFNFEKQAQVGEAKQVLIFEFVFPDIEDILFQLCQIHRR